MKRRAFLGFLGGAAAAGPAAAKSLASEAVTNRPMPYVTLGARGGSTAAAPDSDWKLQRIAELKRVISGRDPEAEHYQKMDRLYAAESVERFRLDGLRSVSPGHRARMLADGAPQRRARIQKADAKFSLANLLRGS